MQRFAPTWEVETCHFEVPLSNYTWREERDGAVTMGTVSPEPPASVRIYEPDSDHFHQGYLTSWYVDPDYDHPQNGETTAPDKWWREYNCKVVFYGDLECLCW